MPKIKRGMKKATVTRLMKKYGYRVKYKYTYGKKNVVLKTALPTYWTKYPQRKWSKARHRFLFSGSAKLIVTLGNGKEKPRPWHTGTATWYSIADNTPAGSRQTSTGHPLGWNNGFTFASTKFPAGTKLRIKGPNGRTKICICTDRGGLETIDLYKPASDYFGMSGMSRFKYQVIRRGW